MDEIQKDERFAHTLTDPRFRRPHIKQRKIKIDSRFKSMLKDKEFSNKVTVDKRGRPITSSTKENLERLYDYESEEEEDDSSGEEDTQNQSEEEEESSTEEGSHQEEQDGSGPGSEEDDKAENETESESESEEEDPIKITEDGPDYARGGGALESSDDDDEDGYDPENDQEGILDHNWNEPDRDAPEAAEITHRLALCNMDWDRIKARDIYVLFNSFIPQGGALRSVNIYISQIGKEKMAEEEKQGPSEFREGEAEEGKDDMGALNRAKLRQYQLNRLKYFFAIIDCDSKETANAIYEECDSTEYEKSACRIDLRFVPDDMTFDETLKESSTGISDMTSFEPSTFTSTAFCQANVQVTWDETNIDRLKKTMRKYTEEDLDKNEFDDLIASSQEESSDEEAVKKKKKKGKKKKKIKASEVKNYRKLLGLDDDQKSKKGSSGAVPSSGDEEEDGEDELPLTPEKKTKKNKKKSDKKLPQTSDSECESSEEKDEELQLNPVKKSKKKKEKQSKATSKKTSKANASDEEEEEEDEEEEEEDEEEEQGMQFTWQPAADLQKLKKKNEKLTPWEEYQQKKKEKKRAKQRVRKKEKLRQNGVEDTADLGFDDPFFNDSGDDEGKKQKKKKKERKKKKQEEEVSIEEDEATKKEKAALGLLMKDDDDHMNHFSLEKIMNEEKDARKKKKGKKRKQGDSEVTGTDNFEVKLDHSRFSALYTNPEMHIDPNAPEFHKTKGMMTLMAEVSKKRKKNS